MPKIHSFQTDFRKGRLGPGLKVRQDTKAYLSSLREAENMMVTTDGRLRRRWGNEFKVSLGEDARIEPWDYADGNATQFLVVFTDGALAVYDLDFTLLASFSTSATSWTSTTMRYLSVARERKRMVITDETVHTLFLVYEPVGGTFSLKQFAFSVSDDETRLNAPFAQFAPDDMVCTLNIFTAAGTSTGYSAYLATALGVSVGDFALGTGALTTDEDYFVADHVGSRMRLLGGELEITAVTDAQTASVKIWRDIAVKLGTDPFQFRKNSTLVQVYAFEHGLAKGDTIFLAGLSADDTSGTVLTKAVKMATDATTAPAPSGGAGLYTVSRIISQDSFEIVGNVASTADALEGGSDVSMFVTSGVKKIREPSFSKARGWPQCCEIHERRLWLGGGASLPDAIWASQFNDYENFDTGVGGPSDAIQLLGIGRQARVRHLVSGFDLQVFSDTEELYIPGFADSAITPETVRVVSATPYGAAYTRPHRFDGGTMYVDAVGQNIREFSAPNRDSDYVATPISIPVPDWVRGPNDSGVFQGGPNEATPYLCFVNSTDGTMLVMHASRADDSLGFMLWNVDGGAFRSVCGIGSRLFAVVQIGTSYSLVEFDTTNAAATGRGDLSVRQTGASSTSWTSLIHAEIPCQIYSGYKYLGEVTPDVSGNFTTPEAVTDVTICVGVDWSFELHPPAVGTGQGPKAGKILRIVSAEVNWDSAYDGSIEGEYIVGANDLADDIPVPIDEWREYHIGTWGREPTLTFSGEKPLPFGVRAVVMNVYV